MTPDQIERSMKAKVKTSTTKPKTSVAPITKAKATSNRLKALEYKPLPVVNPYPEYENKISGLITSTTGSLQGDLDRIAGDYTKVRDQILASFGNTDNKALLNARDLALGELNRQADDATRQVAANYEAAQARQAGFADRQLALAEQAAIQNQSLANVNAGNMAAWNQQLGVTDGDSTDMAAMYADRGARDAAVARALGATAAGFENAMGTSIGEQQMAIQGQIARDLANRSGVVSTQTARDIAAAEMANNERLNNALLDLSYRQLGAEGAARDRVGDRTFALEQALIDAGLAGGMFNVDNLRSESDRRFNYRNAALDQQAREDARIAAAAASAAANARFEREWARDEARYQDALNESNRQFGLDEKKVNAAVAGDQPAAFVPPSGLGATYFTMVSNSKNPKVSADSEKMYTLGTLMQPRGMLTNEQAGTAMAIFGTLSPETRAELKKNGIANFDDMQRKYRSLQGTSTAGRDAYYGGR
jgi:hypothetical protein